MYSSLGIIVIEAYFSASSGTCRHWVAS